MAKLSRQVKEIIKTILFFGFIALLVFAYVIYPLTRTKTLMARQDLGDRDKDSLVVNDPASFAEAGLTADTLRIEADGLTKLACLYISPEDSATAIRGTAIILHDDGDNRDSLAALVVALNDSGYVVMAYDQRASGRTTGIYRGAGYYEARDVEAVISYLEIRNMIRHPLFVVGYGLGADAALLAAREEQRIDGIVMINPYLTVQRYQDILKRDHLTFWFPFQRTIMFWWYKIRSGYAPVYTKVGDIQPVDRPALMIVSGNNMSDAEVQKLQEVSSPELLKVAPMPVDPPAVYDEIVAFLSAQESS
ncbi:MAG: alpha/beta hydrolase [Candidatus Zixiibacteriota bacterium]|nr:MAG: alpha/beta hydrolase [candidate division Zixibacteria bacterium]